VKRIALLLAVAVGLPAAAPVPPESAEARRVFAAYISARDRHDFDAIRALTDPDIRAFDTEGHPHPWNEARLRDVLAWEARMNARWRGRVLGWSEPWLEVEASEENDLYEALGVGAAIGRHRLRVVGGRIVEWHGRGERSTGRDETAAMSEFEGWVRGLPPDVRSGALNGRGQLVLAAEGARAHARLILRWKEEHPVSSP
jgi:hypothetical protein